MSQPEISLIHTTARPERCDKVAECWYLRADHPGQVEHVITYDRTTFEYLPNLYGFGESRSHPQDDTPTPTKVSPVAGWNKAARLSTGKVLVLVSDDYFPPLHWDTLILGELKPFIDANASAVLWVRNVAYIPQNIITLWHHLICHPIMTRAYYERLGYFFAPWYFGRGVDNEFTDVAIRDKAIVDARDRISFVHQDAHPAYEPLDFNEANSVVSAHYAQDWQTYLDRRAAGFPSEWPQNRATIAAGGL